MAKSLLDLPRELRNIIYEYALTEEDGLLVQEWPTMHPKAAGAKYGTDANQLKFTCRQLYTETTGLGLRYNKVTFGGSCGFEAFKGFTEVDCTPAHFGRVKRVVIVQERGDKVYQELKRAHAIGEAYPALSIDIRCEWLTEATNFYAWFAAGTEIHYALCDTLPDITRAAPGLTALFMIVARSRSEILGYGCSKNFQIYPASFDEERLRLSAEEMHFGDIEGGLDGWIAQCKKWFQEGF